MTSTDFPRILVVDDNRDNANIIRQYLEAAHGYEILVAHDGDEALRMIEAEHPGIVLLDVMMPGRSGWDVCRIIKSHPQWGRKTRVVMVTALDDLANKRQAIQSGADDFLEKPFDFAKLIATVRRNAAALTPTAA